MLESASAMTGRRRIPFCRFILGGGNRGGGYRGREGGSGVIGGGEESLRILFKKESTYHSMVVAGVG